MDNRKTQSIFKARCHFLLFYLLPVGVNPKNKQIPIIYLSFSFTYQFLYNILKKLKQLNSLKGIN